MKTSRQAPAHLLVVGGTGTIGSAAVKELRDHDEPVRVLTRRPHVVTEPGATAVIGDLADRDTLGPAFQGVRRALIVTNDPALEPAAIDAATSAGVELLVLSSAMGPGGQPPPGHAAAEHHLATSGVPWVVLRPNAFMQTFAEYLQLLVGSDGTFRLPAAGARTGWVDARDIGAVAAALLLDPDPRTHIAYTVTGPKALSMDEVASDLTAARGRRYAYEAMAPADAAAQMEAAGLNRTMAGFLAQHYAAVRNDDFDVASPAVPNLTGRPAGSWRTYLDEHPRLF